jgi:Mce-associated membrane protein
VTERNRATRRAPSVAGRKSRRPEPREASFVVRSAPEADPVPQVAAQPPLDDTTSRPVARAGRGVAASQRGVVVTALAALALASVVSTVVLLVTGLARHDSAVRDQKSTEAARAAAAAAARTAATAVLSYDYRHFSTDVARAERLLTGKLRTDYVKLQRTSVGPTARQVHATVTATVKGAAVVAATPTTATVLVFVDQRSDNTRIAAPRLDQNRVTMQLVRSGGRWLVSAFDAV